MSYTNSTTHYHIPLPTQTDLVNGLDWNDSSEAIDTAIYEASQAAGTAASDIVTIKQDIVDLKAEDVDIKQAATELAGRVSTLEQNATLDEQAIQDVADMITDKEVSQAQSDVHVDVDEWFRYNGVLYVCTVEINVGDTIIPNTNCRATNIEDEMPSGGSTPTAADVSYDGTTAGLTADDVQEAIDELKGLIDQIGGGGMLLDFANAVELAPASAAVLSETISGDKDGALYIATKSNSATGGHVLCDGKEIAIAFGTGDTTAPQWVYGIKHGSVITSDIAIAANGAGRRVTFVPYL